MAITIDDFSKIWASTSPLTPYSFSDDNYKEGWNFVGATPPSRQMWDSIQKANDEKLKYLLDNFDDYLPLAGGTMIGTITAPQTFVNRGVTDDYLLIFGGTSTGDGAYFNLSGKDRDAPSNGQFTVNACDGVDTMTLRGRPDGTLTWNGKEVERVNASGTNYIRFESGLQICWDSVVGVTDAGKAVTFPVAFKDTSYIPFFSTAGYLVASNGIGYANRTTTGITIIRGGSTAAGINYMVIGYWA